MKNLKDLKNAKGGSIKTNIIKNIKKIKFLNNEIKWVILNFSFSLLILIISISSMISIGSNLSKILVYGVYLPLALTHISFSIILSLIAIKLDTPNFYKKWYFYLPLISIVIESIVLPIPLNFITRNYNNAGVLWSTVVFGFIVIILSIIHFSIIYKNNLNDLSVIDSNENDNVEKKETKVEPSNIVFEKSYNSNSLTHENNNKMNENLEIEAKTPNFDISNNDNIIKFDNEEIIDSNINNDKEDIDIKNNSLNEN